MGPGLYFSFFLNFGLWELQTLNPEAPKPLNSEKKRGFWVFFLVLELKGLRASGLQELIGEGFRVWGLGFGVLGFFWGLGFRVLGFRVFRASGIWWGVFHDLLLPGCWPGF